MTAPDLLTPAAVLKARTADHHHRAERSTFQRQMVSGRLARTEYIRWLGQMLVVHQALERAFADRHIPAQLAALMTPRRRRTPDLARDLEHFSSAAGASLAATAGFASTIDAWGAVGGAELVGGLYVFEGSTNGGRHIARGVRRGYRLGDHGGTAFLDPYGEAQGERWVEFKEALDQAVDARDLPAVIAGAETTFDAVAAIGGELLATAG